jgi:hypothetical protein
MKRDPALVTLSHDHHLALYVARTLKRATADTASDGRAAFVAYWEEHGREHFRLEERQLFPLIEAALPTTRLATVAAALENAEGCAGSALGA